MSSRSIVEAQSLWDPAVTSLNTKSYGPAAARALATIEELGVDAINGHDVALANRFRAGLGVEPGDSAIVMSDAPGAAQKLASAGIQAAVRGGKLRTSWHVYNTERDVDRTLDVLSA